ncbi:hypothetical protein [Streptomyces sp. NPDC020965]|uniref:hypothetical protein n=1 Tax=Streptomyces sp. NPDC020965 TaxID=3365105 RepID=UPI00379E7813
MRLFPQRSARSRTAAKARTAVLGALSAVVVAIPLSATPAGAAGAAGAAEPTSDAGTTAATARLNGHWGPFTRCPVDNPAMRAADGRTVIATCVSSQSPSGSIKLGKTAAHTGANDLQFGVLQNTELHTFTVVPPAGGAIVGAPTEIPGGLLGIACPADLPVITAICKLLTDNSLNRVTATVESAGTPTGFNLAAGLSSGKPIVNVPVRIRLQNPLLGSQCYIGSAADPIVLKPQNTTNPTLAVQRFDGDGTPNTAGAMLRFALSGNSQGDSGFAVPKANGCGLLGILNGAIDLKVGLPSPAGTNNLVLNNASTYSAGLAAPGLVRPDNGKILSQYWHSAVLP